MIILRRTSRLGPRALASPFRCVSTRVLNEKHSRHAEQFTVFGIGFAVAAIIAQPHWSNQQLRSYCATQATSPIVGSPGASLADADVVVYQYKICPFCNKLKAVMDYLGIPYSVIEVNPLTKKEIKFSMDYQKVPIVRFDGMFLRDSPEILRVLLDRLLKNGSLNKDQMDKFASSEALSWADWADKQLAVLLFPNITRSFKESYQAFSYVNTVETFSFLDKTSNQALGSFAMWLAQGKIKKKYNIDDERKALQDALDFWIAEIEGKDFSGGSSPNLGDLCVFGCLRAIEGLDAFEDIIEQNNQLFEWYTRVKNILNYGPM